MAMKIATGQEKIGENLYFFTSLRTGGDPTCVIYGHGGLVRKADSFPLPQNITMGFLQPHGSEKQINRFDLLSGDPTKKDLECTSRVWNYSLEKILGSHNSSHEGDVTYEMVRKTMEDYRGNTSDWLPNICVIRNRFLDKRVTLKDVIAQVMDAKKHITRFVYAACRGIEGEKKTPPPQRRRV